MYRIAVDTGGTFTDVVVADGSEILIVEKSLTTPDRIAQGMKEAMGVAAAGLGLELGSFLARSDLLIYGTTRATNAIVEAKTARTALLTTEGFPDILSYREGGRLNPHNFSDEFPAPYIPRRCTFEIRERTLCDGSIHTALDVGISVDILERLRQLKFSAVAVSFLWSISNPSNELAMAELIEKYLPGVPYTLSHRLIPIIREYRRASATAIDASLKPLMQNHLRALEQDLRGLGFAGEVLVSTSMGGCMYIEELVERPIHSVKSGPSMAPIAGRTYAHHANLGGDVIVCDTGGTTFDVGLIRDGQVVFTRETWIGEERAGHLISISSVDVRSIGAGGGSIAWIDPGGLLHVGPHSAGADPGPACYGKGGSEPTVTDACAVLGYLDPTYFLGGRMSLDQAAAKCSVAGIANELSKSVEETAFAIVTLASEHMIKAISEITINEGFDPRESVLVAGGGAAGLNILLIARELGCPRILVPRTAGALSATGMQFSDIVFEHSMSKLSFTNAFDFDGVNDALQRIDDELMQFHDRLRREGHELSASYDIIHFVEARYLYQVWEIEVQMPVKRFASPADLDSFITAFHREHERVYAVTDPDNPIECLNWKGRITIRREAPSFSRCTTCEINTAAQSEKTRVCYFGRAAGVETPIYIGDALPLGVEVHGPAVIEEATTTIVVYPGDSAIRLSSDVFLLSPG